MLQCLLGKRRFRNARPEPAGNTFCCWARRFIAAGLMLSATHAFAFGSWFIMEIYSNNDGSVQFVELFTEANGQERLAGLYLESVEDEGAVFKSLRLSENSASRTSGRSLLIGTESMAAAAGVTPDFIIPVNFLPLNGGSVNFAGFISFEYDDFPDDPADSLMVGGAFRASPRNYAGVFGALAGFDPEVSLFSSVLPTSRSVEVGTTATVFATLLNAGTAQGTDCDITIDGSIPADLQYQTTNSATNGLTGSANQPVDIPAGGSQSFLLALTPTAAFDATPIAFDFGCGNAAAAPVFVGLNTLSLAASTTPVPDIVTLAATPSGDGITTIDGPTATGVFATATVNLGSAANLTVVATAGAASLPLTLALCETNPTTGACINPLSPASTVIANIGVNGQPTFSVFATATGDVPFDPAVNRIFIEFIDGSGALRGSASVAVRTLSP